MKKIDAHMHIAHHICGFSAQGELTAIGGGRAQYANGEIISIIPPELGDVNVTPEKLIALMDREEVERGVLLQGMYLGFQNRYVAEAVRKYPDRLTGASTYDPFCLDVTGIRRALFDEMGFTIEKFELAALMNYHGRVDLGGEVMTECFDFCDEHGHVCVLDLGRPDSVSCQTQAIRRQILRHPNMKFVICHILAPRRGGKEAMLAGLKDLLLPNVWFDYAALLAFLRPEPAPYSMALDYLKAAKDLIGADRLLFGSDIPSTMTSVSYDTLVRFPVEGGIFEESELPAIFYENARNVYFNGK